MYSLFQGHENMQVIEGDNFFLNYKVTGKLGAGNSAVYSVEKNNEEEKALKEIMIKSELDFEQFKKEADLLKIISQHNHPHIIKYYDSCVLGRAGEFSDLKIAYILLEKGITSLDKIVDHQTNFFPIEKIRKFIKDSINVHTFLQKQKIAHCDIKPENILISDINKLEIKICDIGCGKMIKNDDTYTSTISGTIPFLAPELLMNYSKSKMNHNPFKSDVYSLGLCFIYFITFTKFTSMQRMMLPLQAFNDVIQEWIQQSIQICDNDPLVTSILPKMLTLNQEDRLDFFELKNYHDKLEMPQQLITESFVLPHSQSIQDLKQYTEVNLTPQFKRKNVNLKYKPKQQGQMLQSDLSDQKISKPFLVQNTNSPRKFSVKKVNSPNRNSSIFQQKQVDSPSSMKHLDSQQSLRSRKAKPQSIQLKTSSFSKMRLTPLDFKSPQSTKSSFFESSNRNNQLLQSPQIFNQRRYYFFEYNIMKEICELAETFVQNFDKEVIINGDDEQMVNELGKMPGIKSLCFIGTQNLQGFFQQFGSFGQLQQLELFLDGYNFNGKESRKLDKKAIKLKNLNEVELKIRNSSGEVKQFLLNLMCQIFKINSLRINLDFFEDFIWIQQFLDLNYLEIEFRNITIDDGQHKKLLENIKKIQQIKEFKFKMINCTLLNVKSSGWSFGNQLQKLELNYDSTNICQSSFFLSVVHFNQLQTLQLDLTNMQITDINLMKLFIQNIRQLKQLKEFKLIINYISNFNFQAQSMLWDKIKEVQQLQIVEVQQKGVETDLLVIQKFLELGKLNYVQLGLICNRVASIKDILELNEKAMVVYVDVESIGIRFTSRNCEDKYKNWMECIDCKSKIDGDCIQQCHLNHRIISTDFFGFSGLLESETESECCVHQRRYCTSIFGKIKGFPRKCLTCDIDYLCQYCIEEHHNDHSVLTHNFRTKFKCENR